MKSLNILHNNQLVGNLKLIDNSDEFVFAYDDTWIKNGFALAPSLPLNQIIDQKKARNFIENLLPEGQSLDELIYRFNLSKNNYYSIIEAIGSETTGALTFSANLNNKELTSFREIPFEELSQRIANRRNTPLLVWDDKPRISIAGVQEKLVLCIIDNKYGLASGNLASTHILKFEKYEQDLVLNEFISLQLAKLSGLDIPNIEIIKFNDEQVLKVQRFDRKVISNTQVQRLHIIDMCQVQGVPVSFKYERPYGNNESTKDIRNGISFKNIFDSISFTKIPITQKKKIIDWVIVNLCLGNCDAHGKNISFFVQSNGKLELTPFYDIVNIQIYKDKYSTELAMGFYDEFDINNLKAYDFIEFCIENNINIKAFKERFFTISNKMLKNINSFDLKKFDLDDITNNNFLDNYKKDCVNRINKLINNIELI